MRTRNIALITAGIVGAGVGGAALVSAVNDGESQVEPVTVADVELADPSATSPGATGTPGGSDPSAPVSSDSTAATDTAPGGVQQVDGLEKLVGVLQVDDDLDDWYVLGVEVDFGPEEWVFSAPAIADYDGDGTVEPLLDELRGLEGREVTLGVRYDLDDDDRDDAYVFTINGLVYRDATGGPAPWQRTATAPATGSATESAPAERALAEPAPAEPARAGGPVSADEAATIGAAATGGTVIDVWPGTEGGRDVFYVDVRTADGLAEVYVDAATGDVLRIESGD